MQYTSFDENKHFIDRTGPLCYAIPVTLPKLPFAAVCGRRLQSCPQKWG